jgi:hypothetical protein
LPEPFSEVRWSRLFYAYLPELKQGCS